MICLTTFPSKLRFSIWCSETRSEIGASATANAYASASSSSGGSYSSKTIDDLTQIIPCLNIDDFNLKPPSLVPVDQSENEEETPEPEAPNPDPIVDTPRDSFLAENGEVITADDPRWVDCVACSLKWFWTFQNKSCLNHTKLFLRFYSNTLNQGCSHFSSMWATYTMNKWNDLPIRKMQNKNCCVA